jgi:cyclase
MQRTIPFVVLMFAAGTAAFAQGPSAPEGAIKVSKVAGNLHILQGAKGGNIAVSVGEDGVLMIDAQTLPYMSNVPGALKEITNQPVRFLINTHFHSDHTDGNTLFGPGTIIIAHDNVRKRLETGGVGGNFGLFRFEYKPLPKQALPVLTFNDELTLHFNGEDIRVMHFPNSHTDGDAVVYFPKSNVVHLGDEFVTYGFPDIEIASGGKCQGTIDTLEKVIRMVPADAIVIPGHGPVSNLDDVRRFIAMLKGTQAAVEKGIAQGKTLAEMQREKVLEPWKSWAGGLFSMEVFTEFLYNDLTKKSTWGASAQR